VIDPVITPVVLPSRPPNQFPGPAARRALPLPSAPPSRTSTAIYGMAAVDCRGRIADHTIVSSLGWNPNARLDIRPSGGLLAIRPSPDGVLGITKQGHLRLPAGIRHSCGIHTADRVLLVAYPERDLLVIHPPAALDTLVASRHAHLQLMDGDST
jgi:hypothetical protein